MKSTKFISVLAMVIAVVALVFSINKVREPVQEEKVESIKIGVVVPLTGKVANYGQDVKNGLEMALNKIKIRGASQIQLFYEDEMCNPEETTKVVQRLIGISKIKL